MTLSFSTKVTSLSSERDAFAANLSESKEAQLQLEENFKGLHESSQTEVANLLDKLDGKTKAGQFFTILSCRNLI